MNHMSLINSFLTWSYLVWCKKKQNKHPLTVEVVMTWLVDGNTEKPVTDEEAKAAARQMKRFIVLYFDFAKYVWEKVILCNLLVFLFLVARIVLSSLLLFLWEKKWNHKNHQNGTKRKKTFQKTRSSVKNCWNGSVCQHCFRKNDRTLLIEVGAARDEETFTVYSRWWKPAGKFVALLEFVREGNQELHPSVNYVSKIPWWE